MSINVSAINQNYNVNNAVPAFRGKKVPSVAKEIISDQPKTPITFKDVADWTLKIGGFIFLIGLVIGGWISSCTSKNSSNKPQTEVKANAQATSAPQIENIE